MFDVPSYPHHVLITGGSRGIGAAAVHAFAAAGYNVAFTWHAHPEAADAVLQQVQTLYPQGRFLAIQADAANPEAACHAVLQAETE